MANTDMSRVIESETSQKESLTNPHRDQWGRSLYYLMYYTFKINSCMIATAVAAKDGAYIINSLQAQSEY